MIGACFFLGWTCTLLWLPAIADRRGRKNIFWLAMFAQLCLFVGLLTTRNLIVMLFIMFSFGGLSAVRVGVGYVYLMEMLPRSKQTSVTSGWNTQEALIYVFATIYFWKISRHWFWFVLIGFVWQILSCVLLFWMPESPRYLITVGKLEEARKAFSVIARFNRKKLEWDPKRFSPNESGEKEVPAKSTSQSDSNLQLSVGNLPLNLTEQQMRQWLEQEIGGELSRDVVGVEFTNNDIASTCTFKFGDSTPHFQIYQ